MDSTKTAGRTTAAVQTEPVASDRRAHLLPKMRTRESVPPPAAGVSDAMRTVIWITGVAFGVAAPGAFAQAALDASAAPTNPAFIKLDANHDGFVNRAEARRDQAVNSAFDQADMNHDGKLDEDEYIKALSISQRETVDRIAVDSASAAKRYAADSEITARVKTALLRAEGLRSLEISVQTNQGKVQLAGFADSKVQIAQAGTIAAHEPGVKAVLNDLAAK